MRQIVALTLWVITGASVHADSRIAPRIQEVRVGFPAYGSPAGLFKSGCWVPIEIRFHPGTEQIENAKIQVETADSEETQTVYTVPIPNNKLSVGAYTKPGSLRSTFNITVEADQHRLRETHTLNSLDVADTLCLYLGGNPAAFSHSLSAIQIAETESRTAGACRLAAVDNVQALPDRWFGYSAVDLVILPTANRTLIDQFLQADNDRKQALAEFVRRGGHLLISCGRNRNILPDISRELGIEMPFSDGGPLTSRTLDHLRTWTAGHHSFPTTGPVFQDGIRLNLTPGGVYQSLLPPRLDEQSSSLVIRWPVGNGQVTLVAIDLDDAPFTAWAGQADFWKVLLPRCGVKIGVKTTSGPPNTREESGASDVATLLQQELDQFPTVRVVPFGWIALLVLVFIMVVGPVSYFFHSRVLGGVHLNWIIFSIAAVAVTVTACVAAYALKGTELRINKLDLVDIDLTGRRCYGTTWFTLYSPRTESFTMGIEPAASWGSVTDDPDHNVVSWLGRPEAGFGGYDRPRSVPAFRRTYEFAPNARGLKNVPIPVWSSKSFTANWAATIDFEIPASRLQRRRPAGIDGSVVNPLPVALAEVALIYGETESQVKVYQLGTLAPRQHTTLSSAQEMQLSQWLTSATTIADRTGLMRRIMFYDATVNLDGIRDRPLDKLDQSWRRALRNSAILVGRTARLEGPVEEVTQDSASPSRLWLGRLPQPGEVRPTLTGALTQDTYVRMLVPVLPTPASAPTQPNP